MARHPPTDRGDSQDPDGAMERGSLLREVGSSGPTLAAAVEAFGNWFRRDVPSGAVQEGSHQMKTPSIARGRYPSKFPPLRAGLLFLFGRGLFCGLLRSLLSCVLHRTILPNVNLQSITDRSVIHI